MTFSLMRLMAVAALPAALGAQATKATSPADAALNRALRAYAATRTTRALFEQTLINPLTGTTASASGELFMRKPNQLAVRFVNPAGDRLVADGRLLWVYLPSQNPKQVMRLPQGKAGTGGIDVMGQFFDAPRTRYTITDAGAASIGGRATRALKLMPKAGSAAAFVQATVWVDDKDGRLRQFEVTDANGLVRRVALTKVDVNGALPKDVFRFVIPEGVKVVAQPGMP